MDIFTGSVPTNVGSTTGMGNYDGTSYMVTGVGANTTEGMSTTALPEGWATNPLDGVTGQTLPVNDQDVYTAEWLANTMPNLPFEDFAERPYSFKQGDGETVKFKRMLDMPYDNPSLYEISDGLTPEGMKVEVSFVSAKVSYYGGYVIYTDRSFFHDPLGIMKEVKNTIAPLGTRVANNVTRNVIFGTANWYHFGAAESLLQIQGTGTVDGDIAQIAEDLEAIITYLETRNVEKISEKVNAATGISTEPIDAAYICFCSPKARFSIIEKLPDFVPVRKYASQQNTVKGEIGTFKNIKFIASTSVPVYDSASTLVDINAVSTFWKGTANVQFQDSNTGSAESGTTDFAAPLFPFLIFGKGAYGVVPVASGNPEIIAKDLGSSGTNDPLNQRGTIGFKFGKTAAILDAQRMVCYNAPLPTTSS
jgi:N4-gp56 family major capsid protein